MWFCFYNMFMNTLLTFLKCKIVANLPSLFIAEDGIISWNADDLRHFG